MSGRSWGEILLCLFLILFGLLSITNLSFQFAAFILGGLAIVAGILKLLGK